MDDQNLPPLTDDTATECGSQGAGRPEPAAQQPPASVDAYHFAAQLAHRRPS